VDTTADEWVQVISYENLPQMPRPAEALTAWLRERGIYWLPFADDAIRVDVVCGKKPDGQPKGWYSIKVRSSELRRLGLHSEPGAANP
jgi:hypothetical protein